MKRSRFTPTKKNVEKISIYSYLLLLFTFNAVSFIVLIKYVLQVLIYLINLKLLKSIIKLASKFIWLIIKFSRLAIFYFDVFKSRSFVLFIMLIK